MVEIQILVPGGLFFPKVFSLHKCPNAAMESSFFFKEQIHALILTVRPENRPGPKRKQSYSNHPFSGVNSLLVSGRVYIFIHVWHVFFHVSLWKCHRFVFFLQLCENAGTSCSTCHVFFLGGPTKKPVKDKERCQTEPEKNIKLFFLDLELTHDASLKSLDFCCFPAMLTLLW